MQIELTPEVEELIRRRIAGGRYTSAHHVVAEALRLLENRDSQLEQERQALRRSLVSAEEEVRRTGGVPLDEAFGRVRQRSKEVKERHQDQP